MIHKPRNDNGEDGVRAEDDRRRRRIVEHVDAHMEQPQAERDADQAVETECQPVVDRQFLAFAQIIRQSKRKQNNACHDESHEHHDIRIDVRFRIDELLADFHRAEQADAQNQKNHAHEADRRTAAFRGLAAIFPFACHICSVNPEVARASRPWQGRDGLVTLSLALLHGVPAEFAAVHPN